MCACLYVCVKLTTYSFAVLKTNERLLQDSTLPKLPWSDIYLFHRSTCRLKQRRVCLCVSLCPCVKLKFPLNTTGEKNPFAHTLSPNYPCTARAVKEAIYLGPSYAISHALMHVHIQANHNSNGDGDDAKDKRAVRRLLPRGGRSTGGDSQEREKEITATHAHTHTISAWMRVHTLHMETQRRWDMSPGTQTHSSVISLFYKIHLNRLSQDSQRQRMLLFFSVNSNHIVFSFFRPASIFQVFPSFFFSDSLHARSIIARLKDGLFFVKALFEIHPFALRVWWGNSRTNCLPLDSTVLTCKENERVTLY